MEKNVLKDTWKAGCFKL